MPRLVALATFLACLVPSVSQAQVLIGVLIGNKVTSPKFHLGVALGANLPIDDRPDMNFWAGFHLQLYADWRFSKRFLFQPGLIAYEGYPLRWKDDAQPDPPSDFSDEIEYTRKARRNISWFGIPLIVKAEVHPLFQIGLGPQVNLRSGATNFYQGASPNGNSVQLREVAKSTINYADIGAVLWLEVKFSKKSAYSPGIAFRFYNGFLDIAKSPNIKEIARIGSIVATLPVGAATAKKREAKRRMEEAEAASAAAAAAASSQPTEAPPADPPPADPPADE